MMTKPKLAALTIAGVSANYSRVLRPWHMNWGASDDEAMANAASCFRAVAQAPPRRS